MTEPDLNQLSPKRRLFVQEYLSNGMNATQAAIAVGFSKRAAHQRGPAMLKEPKVAAAVAALVESRSQRLKISTDWVLQEAVTVYARCMQQEKVLDRDGNPTGEFRFDPTNALRALQLIGKHVDVGAFQERADNARNNAMVERLLRGRDRAGLPLEHPQEPQQQPVEDQAAMLERLLRAQQRAGGDQDESVSFMGDPVFDDDDETDASSYPDPARADSIVIDGEYTKGGN